MGAVAAPTADLDLTTGTATIRRSLQRTRTSGLTHLPTKTRASERRIALPTECLHSLKEHQQQQDKERETAGATWQDGGLVFTTPTGRPLDPANLTRRFRSFLNRAGLRAIASTTSATQPPPCSWNRASTSS
ncbi:integrase [Streptomyces sp. V1I6]|nr:integrase [Streptomyces sp. V1I6]